MNSRAAADPPRTPVFKSKALEDTRDWAQQKRDLGPLFAPRASLPRCGVISAGSIGRAHKSAFLT